MVGIACGVAVAAVFAELAGTIVAAGDILAVDTFIAAVVVGMIGAIMIAGIIVAVIGAAISVWDWQRVFFSVQR